ncbi:unnamed protein product [Taenia asiatica]|uniref:Uncharacterized protein n=1 Tax=Taenia asiatica TaxID=60517 RepID=A0A0R3WGX0_TAEAS|nr:unnamed protein product [Taenia asiatica]
MWQASPSPSKSGGVAKSVLVTRLRSAPRTSAEQIGEESSPPFTHPRCLAVHVGTADRSAHLRLLHPFSSCSSSHSLFFKWSLASLCLLFSTLTFLASFTPPPPSLHLHPSGSVVTA